jgi:hypothetical protein
MRRLKSHRNDPLSLGCIYLCLVSTAYGYIIKVDPLNDLKETEAFEDGRVPHKRTFGGIEEGFEEDVDGGAAGGDVGNSDGGSGRYVSFAEAPPKFIEARKHGKVLLECAATGTPAPQIKWYKDGKPLHKNKKHQKKMLVHHGVPLFRYGQGILQSQPKVTGSLGQIKSKVSLDCLTEEDAGVYECVVSNGEQKESATTELRVASFRNTHCHKQLKPTIHQWSEMYMQTTGADALLTCRSAGPHEIYWIGPNGQPVDIKGKKYQMTEQGDLIVRNLSFEDMGNFQCLVKNINGSDMIETFVYPLAES